ncbi:FHA domain-containing protein [Pannus brasiliensis]|uniref:FHA domain-containing protein n=1 Tax=Pannus brasiliensis TaxID=1579216 RepID=UPI003BEEC86F
MITLTLLHPNQATPLQHWTFDEESVIRIGRATDNNVVLYSAVVSRRHVEIRRGDSEWELESLGANGTFMNGKAISKVPVVDGMVIRLASSGPRIQIRLIPDDVSPRLSIERLDSDTPDGPKYPDKETIVT